METVSTQSSGKEDLKRNRAKDNSFKQALALRTCLKELFSFSESSAMGLFELSTGNYPLYRMTSAKKGSRNEFLGDSEKSDYNWLKTPPATPLFQSLEMDATASQLAIQRELPIVLPLSRVLGYNFNYCSDQPLVLHTDMFSLNLRSNNTPRRSP
ncbi:hypothetical protein RHMOL_Rhmol05G0216800 [Rhododendron molle]|uniref:Uncharacterized protein n=1 Tax=Rhododendron molle TaxID=49168 RepID=A0ACC0NRY5_RHOML|nr:hypothetical protein RHMOL_Rhmol05G0216800 [Rhododendron molle]